MASTYGGGQVRDILSVDISSWSDPGIVYKQPAWALTQPQIAHEVWEQIKAAVNGPSGVVLNDDMLVSWFLDPAISYPSSAPAAGRIAANDEPLLINTAGSWSSRPDAATAIPNLFLAADYVRTNVNLATMEGANEAGRLAVNALLTAAGSTAPPAQVFPLYRPPEWDALKQIDDQRFRSGQPNLLDTPALPDLRQILGIGG